jgi:hypothetical protein
MKKLLVLAVLTATLFASCDKKKSDAEPKAEAETAVVAKDTITDADRYEGKIVKGSNNQWYLIKDGLRWRTNSVEASVDYLKTIPESPDNTINFVPIETLQQFPEVGEIFPKLQYKKDPERATK